MAAKTPAAAGPRRNAQGWRVLCRDRADAGAWKTLRPTRLSGNPGIRTGPVDVNSRRAVSQEEAAHPQLCPRRRRGHHTHPCASGCGLSAPSATEGDRGSLKK